MGDAGLVAPFQISVVIFGFFVELEHAIQHL